MHRAMTSCRHVHFDFGTLPPFVVHIPQSLHKIDPGIVFTLYKRALSNIKIKFRKSRLCKKAPETRVRVVFNK
jgi:hypothetical protein